MCTMSVTRSGREQRAWAEAGSAILVLQRVKPDLTDMHRPRSYVKPQTENERKTSDRYRPCVFSRRLFGSPVSLYGSSFRSQRSLDIPPEPRSTQRQKHPGICSCHISFIKQISPPMGRLNAIISERNGGNKVHGTEVEAYPTYTLCHRAKRIV